MAVAKRQGREKPMKIEQRKVRGRSRTGVRTSGRPALLPATHTLHAGVLLHSLLFFKDGFSCYLLSKIEL